MREFKTSCIDNETGMEMVLSECSYNMACRWLASKGFTDYDDIDTSYDNGVSWVKMVFSKPSKRTFMYDESRGYLLGN